MKKITLVILTLAFLGHIAWAQMPKDTMDYTEMLNLSYLPAEKITVDSLQQLNLVLPKGVENPPLLLWIGGGAWSFVNRHMEMGLARQFGKRGIAVASVGHQLSKGAFSPNAKAEGVKHPAHIKDVAAAFKWLYDHAVEYNFDKENIFVGGFSSGAHLAALLATDPQYLAAHDLQLSQVKGILPIAGAYDIKAYYEVFLNHQDTSIQRWAETHVMDVFGETEEDFIQASPTSYLENLNCPMLLVSEGGLYNYTKVFEEKIWETEYRDCQILHVWNMGHASLWRDLSESEDSQTRRVMIDFIKRQAG